MARMDPENNNDLRRRVEQMDIDRFRAESGQQPGPPAAPVRVRPAQKSIAPDLARQVETPSISDRVAVSAEPGPPEELRTPLRSGPTARGGERQPAATSTAPPSRAAYEQIDRNVKKTARGALDKVQGLYRDASALAEGAVAPVLALGDAFSAPAGQGSRAYGQGVRRRLETAGSVIDATTGALKREAGEVIGGFAGAPIPTSPVERAGFERSEPEFLTEPVGGPLSEQAELADRGDAQTAVPNATPAGGVGNVSFGPMIDPKTGKPMMARTVVPGDRPGTTRIVETPIEGYSGSGGPNGVTVTRNGLQRQFDAGGFEGGSLTAEQEAKRAADASSMFWKNLGYASAQDYQNQRRGAPPVSEVGDVNTQLKLLDFQRKLQNDQAKMLQNATEAERKAFGDAQQLASTNPAAFTARYDAELKRMTPQQQKAFLATPVGSLFRATALSSLQGAFGEGAGQLTNLANPEQASEVTFGNPMEISPRGATVRGPTLGPDVVGNAFGAGDVQLSRGELQRANLTPEMLATLYAYEQGTLGEEERR